MLYFYLRPHVVTDTAQTGSLNRKLSFPKRPGRHYLLAPLGAIMAALPGKTDIVHSAKVRCVVSGGFKEAVLGAVESNLEFNADEKQALELAILALLEDLDDD